MLSPAARSDGNDSFLDASVFCWAPPAALAAGSELRKGTFSATTVVASGPVLRKGTFEAAAVLAIVLADKLDVLDTLSTLRKGTAVAPTLSVCAPEGSLVLTGGNCAFADAAAQKRMARKNKDFISIIFLNVEWVAVIIFRVMG